MHTPQLLFSILVPMECSGKRSQSADDDVVQNTFEHLSKKWKQDEIASDVGKCMVTGRITLIWSRKQIKSSLILCLVLAVY